MSSFQEMLPPSPQAYEESQRAGSAGEGVSLGWLQGNFLKSGTSDKRLVLEVGRGANTVPTKAGITLNPSDSHFKGHICSHLRCSFGFLSVEGNEVRFQ